jgi:hypothetical protein
MDLDPHQDVLKKHTLVICKQHFTFPGRSLSIQNTSMLVPEERLRATNLFMNYTGTVQDGPLNTYWTSVKIFNSFLVELLFSSNWVASQPYGTNC